MRRHTAACRPAHLNGFKRAALGDAAADIINHVFDSGADRHFNQSGIVDLTGQRKDFGALALFGAHLAIPFRSVFDDQRDVGPGFNIVDIGRFGVDAGLRRKRWSCPGHAAFALDGGHQGRFFSADKRTGAQSQRKIEVKAGAQDVFAQKSQFFGLLDGDIEMLDGNRILFAHIDVTVFAAHGIGTDEHSLYDGMRVAFQNGAIHECTGIAFVCVADRILGPAFGLTCKFPFKAGGEPRPAAAPEFGHQDLFDDLFG